jgi:hypothetical protein
LELDAIPQNAAEAEALIGAFGEADVPAESAPPAAPPTDEFVINYKGKEERYPREKIISFAQQGRDYAEKMAAFNQERGRWSQLEQEYNGAKSQWAQVEQRLKNYSDIEAYQKQDPQWWQHVNESYQQKLSERGQGGTVALPPEVQEKISQFDQFMSSVTKEREEAQRVKDDQALDLQVSSYRDKYPQFDWGQVDENGQNLEHRILKFAMENGLSKPEHFQIAANNYLFDEHVKRAGHAAKEGVGKHLEKVTKLGLGPITNQPTQRMQQVRNVASKDWNEIGEEAKAALGL